VSKYHIILYLLGTNNKESVLSWSEVFCWGLSLIWTKNKIKRQIRFLV